MDTTNSELEVSRDNSSMASAEVKPFLLMHIQGGWLLYNFPCIGFCSQITVFILFRSSVSGGMYVFAVGIFDAGVFNGTRLMLKM
jgi:hypothetical protein